MSFGLGSDAGRGGGADFFFFTLKIGGVLKFCTVIEKHFSDHLKKKRNKIHFKLKKIYIYSDPESYPPEIYIYMCRPLWKHKEGSC